MEVKDALLKRRSIRKYLDKEVSDEIIELISSVTITVDTFNLVDIFMASIAPIEPLTIEALKAKPLL